MIINNEWNDVFVREIEKDEYKGIYLNEFHAESKIVFKSLENDANAREVYRIEKKEGYWICCRPFNIIAEDDSTGKHLEVLVRVLGEYRARFGVLDEYSNIILDESMSIHQTYEYISNIVNEINEENLSYQNGILSSKCIHFISQKLPLYEIAMDKIKLEILNFEKEKLENSRKIIDIQGRVKTLKSIEEKVKRKGMEHYSIFENLKDIAGICCVCEYLDNVYEVLMFIKNNPYLNILTIEDKIKSPSEDGYRGIHIIVSTDVYYHGEIHGGIKVEIQLRTSFENAWSMKTHQLTYKREHELPPEVIETMTELSNKLFDADETALKMKKIISRINN